MTTEHPKATVRDLIEQNFDSVFPSGFAADEPKPPAVQEQEGEEMPPEQAVTQWAPQQIAARPAFGISQVELDAAKAMSMAGPLVPKWLRGKPGHCWGIIQLSKRWTRYNARTNTWTHYDPITVAQASYLVTSSEDAEGNVAFMSVFIRALIDSFAPLDSRLRFLWHGEAQERKCTCSARLRGETEPHIYTTPPLRQITPKKSPLWASDPDRQLAYYASRAWARLHCAGVLQGVYDEDELEGERMRLGAAAAAPAMLPGSRLHERLQEAKAAQAEGRGGFRPGIVEAGIAAGQEEAPGKAKGAPKRSRPKKGSGQPKKRTSKARAAAARPEPEPERAEPAESSAPSAHIADIEAAEAEREGRREAIRPEPKPEPKGKQAPAPRNLGQYRAHVRRWLLDYTSEEEIEAHWSKERALRNACGITEEDRVQIRAEFIDQRILEVRQ